MNLKRLLKEKNEDNILSVYDKLSLIDKEKLKKDISKVDFNFLNKLYVNSYIDEEMDMNNILPLKCVTYEDIKKEEYYLEGTSLIKNGGYGIVIMAGGNATRLGTIYPKGCLELNIHNRKISLFEIYINSLKKVYQEYKVYIRLYIMTSNKNYLDTVKFFKNNNYFNYPKSYINFFIQDELPLLSVNGKLILEEKNKILRGSNGNGNVFKSLKRSGLLEDMEKNKLKYILFSTVDNALVNLVDYNFLGYIIKNNYKVATKTIFKSDIKDKGWVFCKYNNHPFMIQSKYITEDISNRRENNKYLYRQLNITYHIVSLDEVIKYSNIDLKYHRAYKKYDYIDKYGKKVKATSNNTFKFEQFIFDAFYYSSDMLLYEVGKEEFYPIKDKEDIKAVEDILNKNM